MAKYKQKTLAEILRERKQQYTTLVGKALDRVYDSRDLFSIEQLEDDITKICETVVERFGGLRKLRVTEMKMPLLTLQIYTEEREAGRTEKEILEKYRAEKKGTIAGFRTQYSQRKKKGEVIADTRQRLTSYQYGKARDEGMTNKEIRQKFRLDSPYQMGGFGKDYAEKKRRQEQQPQT